MTDEPAVSEVIDEPAASNVTVVVFVFCALRSACRLVALFELAGGVFLAVCFLAFLRGGSSSISSSPPNPPALYVVPS